MKTIKKILALSLCLCLVLGVLAGCGAKDNNETVPGSNDHEVAEIAGAVLLNANACVEISFDSEGTVLNVQEVDHDGHELLADFAGYLQMSCKEVVKDLVTASCDLELLTNEFNHIVIKEKPGSKLPGETFLADLAAAAEEAAEISVSTIVVTAQEQDAEGNILAKKAYDVLQSALHVDKFDLVESDETLSDGVYTFNVSAGTVEGIYLVEAATGYVYEGSFETVNPDEDYTEDVEAEGTVPDTTEQTQGSSTDSVPEDTASHEESAPGAEDVTEPHAESTAAAD